MSNSYSVISATYNGSVPLSLVKASLCRARVLAMSLPSDYKSDEETRLLTENFGAVRMLDKTKLCDELIPAILQMEN